MVDLRALSVFGGAEAAQDLLRKAIRTRREQLGFGTDELVEFAGIKMDLDGFEQAKSGVSIDGHSAANLCVALGLGLNTALDFRLNRVMNIGTWEKAMEESGLKVLHACGGGEAQVFPRDELLSIYIMTKALEEMDADLAREENL